MTAPAGRGTRTRPGPGVKDNGLRVATSPRERNVPWIVLAVVLIVGFSLLFAVVARGLSDREAVLAVAKAVPAGQVIQDSDLQVVRISADGNLRAIASARRDTVVGQPAAVDLTPGTLVTRAQVGPSRGLDAGKAVVGLALKPGQYPSSRFGPGAHVQVVDTGAAPGAADRPEPVVLAVARVSDVAEAGDAASGTVVASLVVGEREAPDIAAAGAAGRAALVMVGP